MCDILIDEDIYFRDVALVCSVLFDVLCGSRMSSVASYWTLHVFAMYKQNKTGLK